MSNEVFAFQLVMQDAVIAVLMVLYFFMRRREPLALISVIVFGLYSYFFWLLGGGEQDRDQAALKVYATALGLLFSQYALIAILVFHVFSSLLRAKSGYTNAGADE